MRPLHPLAPCISALFIFALGCGQSSGEPFSEVTEQRFDPIIGGVKDTSSPANDAVVMLYITSDPSNPNAGKGACTGTLIAPNVVLTARHCVSETKPTVSCYNDVISDYPANWIYILKGVEPDTIYTWGKQVFRDTSKSLCGHDLALIVTNSPMTTMIPKKVRVKNGPSVGETFKAVGYGLTNPNDDYSAGVRYYRNGVKVTGFTWGTGDRDFDGTVSICQGDSGGPALSSSDAVFGVTSRGGGCYENNNVWTRTDVYKSLIDQAMAAANASYTGEDGTKYGSGGSGGTGGTGGSGGSAGSGGSGGTGGKGGSGGSGGSGGTGGKGGSGGSGGTGGKGGSGGSGGYGG
ncbi:MAG TPA: S1 family peptidase, partial [Polyangiaceae bacterium]|nr:S1 family peptidase [Polyangiaceae bacterium]